MATYGEITARLKRLGYKIERQPGSDHVTDESPVTFGMLPQDHNVVRIRDRQMTVALARHPLYGPGARS